MSEKQLYELLFSATGFLQWKKRREKLVWAKARVEPRTFPLFPWVEMKRGKEMDGEWFSIIINQLFYTIKRAARYTKLSSYGVSEKDLLNVILSYFIRGYFQDSNPWSLSHKAITILYNHFFLIICLVIIFQVFEKKQFNKIKNLSLSPPKVWGETQFYMFVSPQVNNMRIALSSLCKGNVNCQDEDIDSYVIS